MKYIMWGIKFIRIRSPFRLGDSHEQVPQLQEVGHGEHGHRLEVESSDEVGHVGYQIDQHERHYEIMKGF